MGFDDADLEAALAVTRVVRNAADLDRPVDLALVLALMDRENYRITSARRRGEEPEEFNNASANAIFHPGAAAVAGIPPEYQGREALGRYGARLVWCAQHYGMDRLVTPRPAQLVGPTSREFARSAAETFAAVVAELQVPDAKGRSLLDPAFLAALDVPAFLDPRLEFVFRSPVSMKADLRVASPRLQYVGIALQSALFQWFHRKLVQATGAAGDYRQVAEFIAAAPPDPGWDALSLERRDYIAYYAAVYLAYNTASGPGEWNFWMNFAESRRGSFSTADAARATTFLLVHGDPTGQSNRRKGQLGHLARFAVGLDAFLRLDVAGAGLFDFSDPGRRDGVWV
jgi:hypothetical protein